MKQNLLTTLSVAALLALPVQTILADDALKLDNETARINYSLGFQIGGDFKNQNIELDPDAVVAGMRDALSGKEPRMPRQEMNDVLVELKHKVVAAQQAQRHASELQQVEAGRKFMEENAKKPGVMTTASGLQYKILEPGSGSNPGPTDQVTVNYRGTLIDGHEFDSSYSKGKPITFPLNGVIKGWTEGLQLVKPGGRIELVIPPQLAYGNRGPLAHRTLVFDVELLSVGAPAGPAAAPQSAPASQ
jgi:FKBP-type peptidyl-prolyl cis-trans isomerase FklB